MLAGWEIRRRARSTVALTIMVGLVGAVVIATLAGARRSDTALSRFNAYSHSAEVEFSVGKSTAVQRSALRRAPGVVAVARLLGYGIFLPAAPNLTIATQVDDVMGSTVDRPRVIVGRRADPSAAEEVAISEILAVQLHLRLGSTLSPDTYTPKQKEIAFSGGRPGPPAGPKVHLRVVGLVRLPFDLGDRATSGGVVILTQAFDRKYRDRIALFAEGFRVRTRGTAVDVKNVVATATKLWEGDQLFDVSALAIDTEGARDAIDVLTRALWILAGVAALAGFAAIGIVLTRDIANTQLDHAILRALGFTRGERVAIGTPRALLIAGCGALVAGIVAVGASPFFPFGVARRADPNPGLHVDWTVLALALPLVVALVVTIAFFAARRGTRRSSVEGAPRVSARTSPIADLAAGLGLRPTLANGLRMAFESGKGERAVPVRSAFAGAVAGVAGVAAVVLFAASLGHLVATPQLYGWNWDVKGEVPTDDLCLARETFGLSRTPGVGAIAAVCYVNIQINGHPVTAWGFQPVRGVIDPEVVAGRAPRAPHEIALGSLTLDALGKRIGDTVQASGQKGTRSFTIVGRIVLPTIGTPQPLADGATFTSVGLVPILDTSGGNQTHFLVARAKRGVDRAALVRRVAAIPRFTNVGGITVPEEVDHLRQIDWLPSALGGLLGALALLAVGHALVTGVRRRRRELALFKIVGFDRRQVRATVAWQATTLGAVGLLIGIPIGILIGRFVWRLVADGLGVSTHATFPALALILTIPCAVALVNLIAFLPARAAAQIRPAVALRSE